VAAASPRDDVSILVIVGIAASIVTGLMVTEIGFGLSRRSVCERFLRLSIAVLLALGILSVSYAVALFGDLDRRLEPLLPIALSAVAALFLLRMLKAGVGPASSRPPGVILSRRSAVGGGRREGRRTAKDLLRRPPVKAEMPLVPLEPRDTQPSTRVLRALFLAAALIASATAIEHTLREPEGGFDAWAIWNSRARALFRASSPALEAFSPDLARAQFRTHADYPLLVPGLVVEGFRLIGRESIAVPAVVAILFGVLLASTVTLGVADLLGGRWGLLAGSILLSAPIFVTLVVRQCADVPLATFVFAACMLAVYADRTAGAAGCAGRQDLGADPDGALQVSRHLRLIALAGFTLSFAAWCKNEGVVFLLAVPLAFLLRRGIELRARAVESLWWAAGALPVVALLVIFKLHFAPRNDLMTANGWAVIAPLLDPERWWLVARAIGRRVIALHEWGPHLLATIVVVGMLLFRRRRGMPVDPTARSIALALALVALSFGAVYLLTPHDAEWQVRYTFDRLAFQCWPTALLAIFLEVNLRVSAPPRETLPSP
jgi:hypothetical protein